MVSKMSFYGLVMGDQQKNDDKFFMEPGWVEWLLQKSGFWVEWWSDRGAWQAVLFGAENRWVAC